MIYLKRIIRKLDKLLKIKMKENIKKQKIFFKKNKQISKTDHIIRDKESNKFNVANYINQLSYRV